MAHQHWHLKDDQASSRSKLLAVGIVLNLLFVVAEVFYGLRANSTALLADAGHNALDVLSLVFALIASWLASKRPRGKYTFGFKRTTILVSLTNAVILFGASGIIAWEAFQKFLTPQPVEGLTMIYVAGIGVAVNFGTARLFHKSQKDDLNMKGAFLHMMADAAISLVVVLAGAVILMFGILWIDPVLSLVIVVVIVWSTWKLFSEAVKMSVDAVPENVDMGEVFAYLDSQQGVEEVHDLHIWALSTTQTALTAHLVMPSGSDDKFLFELREQLCEKFEIDHTTLQIEQTFDDRHRCN